MYVVLMDCAVLWGIIISYKSKWTYDI